MGVAVHLREHFIDVIPAQPARAGAELGSQSSYRNLKVN